MRRYNLVFLFVLVGVGGCATLKKLSEGAPGFAGKEQFEARVKEIDSNHKVVDQCAAAGSTPDKAGIIEVTAHPDGTVVGRALQWKGAPQVEACVVDAISKVKLSPLAGLPISTVWDFRPKGERPEQPPTDEMRHPIQEQIPIYQGEVEGQCGPLVPPEFYIQVLVVMHVFPGGKVGAVNVVESNAKEGDFERCVIDLLRKKTVQDLGYDGAVPVTFRFKLGLKGKG
jgi:hypothetical protein